MGLDDVLNKARDIVSVAAKKTEDTVVAEKKKVDLAVLRSKREKDFAELGRLYFEKYKREELPEGDEKTVMESIKEKNKSIAALVREINSVSSEKSCAVCLEAVPTGSEFCPNCGAKI